MAASQMSGYRCARSRWSTTRVDVAARAIHVHGSSQGAAYATCRAVTSGTLRPEMDGVPAIDFGELFALLR